MSLKIFHIADLHLGRSFRYLPEAQEILSKARYKPLQNCIDKANELSANIFVIAGDLFDRTSMNVGDIDANRRKNGQSHQSVCRGVSDDRVDLSSGPCGGAWW